LPDGAVECETQLGPSGLDLVHSSAQITISVVPIWVSAQMPVRFGYSIFGFGREQLQHFR